MTRVVALGECMVELSLTGVESAQINFAGDTFNTAIYLRRLGLEVAYGVALGDGDPFSRAMLARMADEGVATDLVVTASGRVPGLYAIERDAAGERRFYYWRGEAPAREYFQLIDLARLQAAMRGARLIYVSAITLAVIGEAGRTALTALLTDCAAAGVPVAFDTNYRARLWPSADVGRASIAAILPACRYLSVSTADVEAFDGDPLALAEAWAARGVEVVLRHEDRRIAVLFGGNVERFGPEPAMSVVDTTGAGDSFNAGYLAARLAGLDVRNAVAAARRLSRTVVQFRGAIIPREAMPPE